MIVIRLSDATMPRFSLKLTVLIVSTLVLASYISWTHLPDSNPHLRIEKDEIQLNIENTNLVDRKETDELGYPGKIGLGLQDKNKQADNNNLPQAKESQNEINQRTDNDETPQLIDKEDTVEQIKEDELTAKSSEQGKVNAAKPEAEEGHHKRKIETFFSALPSSFSDFKTEEEGGIPTKQFLEACINLLPFLELFGRKTMSFAHADLTGNAAKLTVVYEENPEASETLQKLVLHEFENGDYIVDGKGTISLLWLKRGFDFVVEFLHLMADGEEPTLAAGTAYDNHLARHHNFIIRGSFRLAFKTLPFRTDFFKTLAVNQEDTTSPDFERIVAEDMANYNEGITRTFQIIRDFFTAHGLEN